MKMCRCPLRVLARRHPGQARRDPIPDYVDALVAACTRRNPQARPPDGRELLRRVRRVRRALERGVRSDDALAAMVFPAAALPWSVSMTEVIDPRDADTSMLAGLPPLPATDDPYDDDPLTPVEPPLPAVAEPIVMSRAFNRVRLRW